VDFGNFSDPTVRILGHIPEVIALRRLPPGEQVRHRTPVLAASTAVIPKEMLRIIQRVQILTALVVHFLFQCCDRISMKVGCSLQ